MKRVIIFFKHITTCFAIQDVMKECCYCMSTNRLIHASLTCDIMLALNLFHLAIIDLKILLRSVEKCSFDTHVHLTLGVLHVERNDDHMSFVMV